MPFQVPILNKETKEKLDGIKHTVSALQFYTTVGVFLVLIVVYGEYRANCTEKLYDKLYLQTKQQLGEVKVQSLFAQSGRE